MAGKNASPFNEFDVLKLAKDCLQQAQVEINREGSSESALNQVAKAESYLMYLLQQNLIRNSKVRRYVKSKLFSDLSARRPLQEAKVALDSIIQYDRAVLADSIPFMDREMMRTAVQKAKWRMDAHTKISEILSVIEIAAGSL